MGLARRAYRIFEVALLLVVAGEVGVRVAEAVWIDGEVGSLAANLEFHDDYYTLQPGSVIVQPERFGDVTYTFNQLGFRDEDRGPKGGRARILFLGDSVTFGLSVEEDESFPRRVEALLAQQAGDGTSYEAVNFGMFSYSPAHQSRVLELLGLALEPDLLVLQIYMNDFYLGASKEGRKGEAEAAWKRFRARLRVLRDQSALWRRVRQAIQRVTYVALHDLRRTHFVETLSDAEAADKLALFEANPDDASFEAFTGMLAIRDAARRHGIPLLAVPTPSEIQLFRDDYDAINRRIAAFCEKHDIALFDPLEAFRASEHRIHIFNDGVHFSPLGNRVMAELLAPRILELMDARERS